MPPGAVFVSMIVFLSGGITDTNQEARRPAAPQDYADPVRGPPALEQAILTRRRHNPEVGISRRLQITAVKRGSKVRSGLHDESRRSGGYGIWTVCQSPPISQSGKSA